MDAAARFIQNSLANPFAIPNNSGVQKNLSDFRSLGAAG
jgi:hypothetical protein